MTSPVGDLWLAGRTDSLVGLFLGNQAEQRLKSYLQRHFQRESPQVVADAMSAAKEQLTGYFAGELQRFDLVLEPRGSAFQQRVWAELLTIPFGHTLSYGRLAEGLGNFMALRAVATANAKNPISIIIPCHRVIGSDGSMTGYSGGLEMKRHLLELEQQWIAPMLF